MRAHALSVLLFTSAACAGESKFPSSPRPDAGPAPDAVVLVPAGDLTGTDENNFVTAAGEQVVPFDHSSTEIAVYAEAGAEVVRFPGSGTSGGDFQVPGVPAGPVTLQIGATYLVTSARVIDFGIDLLGRADTVPITAPTFLVFDVTGLEPWQNTDVLELVSINAGEFVYGAQRLAMNPPLAGSTRLEGFTLDLQTAEPNGVLIDSTKDDRLIFGQLVTAAGGMTTYQRLEKIFTAAPFTQTNGVTTMLSGVFEALPLTSTIAISWRRSEFEALRAELNPRAAPETQTLFVEAQPGGTAHGNFSSTPDLVIATPIPGDTELDFGEVAFGNPYPAEWPLIAGVLHTYTVPYSLPGARRAARIQAIILAQAEARDVDGHPIGPVLGPVRTPLINGGDAFENHLGAGETPVVSWTAPALGTAVQYRIEILHLTKNVESQATEYASRGVIASSATRVRVPPGLLETGEFYVFSIISSWSERQDLDAHPNRVGLAQAGASVLTGIVSP